MQINPQVPFISDASLEELADELLDRYEREIEPIFRPPVPVEGIADFLLELNLEWLEIPDTKTEPILAYLDPRSKTIRLNERWLIYFEQYPGTYEYTLAHEIAHYQLHLLGDEGQLGQAYVYRFQQMPKDRREWQAERFASYLLMPASLLLSAIEGENLYQWSTLYRLRDQFQVSITALRIRLEDLGYLHVTANGQLYPSQTAAISDQRREVRRLVSLGQLYRTLGEGEQAREVYQQALNIAQALGNRRDEAFLAWQLGLLYADTDPARAAALMSVCVAYERDVGHPDAEADAEHVARLQARR
jgi:tetratricopeptide (TPR) repeat protein